MRFVLPGKKIQALIIIIIAGFAAYFISQSGLREWASSKFAAKASKEQTLDVIQGQNEFPAVDTDLDGLKDWQEVLWSTDKNMVDSDGDGTPDGEEVVAGRDPSIKGPNDGLDQTRGVSANAVTSFSSSVTNDPDNVTQSISTTLFSSFMAIQGSGEPLDANAEQLLVDSALAFADPGSIPPKYTIADIKVVDSSAVNLKKYGNDLAEAFNAYNATIPSQVTTDLTKYANLINSIKNIPVPGTLGLNHVKILNTFNVSYQTYYMMLKYEQDPAKALVAMKSFQESIEIIRGLFKTVAKELQINAIIFNQGEPGTIWINY